MAKQECDWHKDGIWIEWEMHWCSSCNTEMVDATEECRGAVKAVLAAMVKHEREVNDEPQCAEDMEGFDFEPALAEFARTRKQ